MLEQYSMRCSRIQLPPIRGFALDVTAIKESIGDDLNTLIRWLPGPQQPGDELTKHALNGAMSEIVEQGLWCLVETNEVRELREAQQAQRRECRQRAKVKRDTVESPFGVAPMSGPAEAEADVVLQKAKL